MKILCFSDLHRDRQAAAELVQQARSVDLVIGAGDFANRHVGLSDTLDVLASITVPTVLVPGNGETLDELRAATEHWSAARVLHGDGCEIAGVPIWGVGGGIPVTPFGDWSYDFDEETAATLLNGCPSSGILVVHSPPLGIVDHDADGRVRGSRAILDCVREKEPRLVVCGHIHSSWEKQGTCGESTVLNAGPRGCTVELVDD